MVINDILTAECTLLTVISILTGLWYNDIVDANQMEVHKTDGYYDERKKIKRILWWKAFPLMVLSFLSSMVFAFTSVSTVKTIKCWLDSPIEVSVLIVNGVLAILFVVFLVFFVKFVFKLFKP